MENLIQIMLPDEFRGVKCESAYTLNLVENGDKINVYFWRPSVKANGKHFLNIAKSDKKAFIAACKG